MVDVCKSQIDHVDCNSCTVMIMEELDKFQNNISHKLDQAKERIIENHKNKNKINKE